MTLWLNKQVLLKYERIAAKELADVEKVMTLRRKLQGGESVAGSRTFQLSGTMQIGATKVDTSIVAEGLDRVVPQLVSPTIKSTTMFNDGHGLRQMPGQAVEELHGAFLEEAQRINPIARSTGITYWRRDGSRRASTDRVTTKSWVCARCKFTRQ